MTGTQQPLDELEALRAENARLLDERETFIRALTSIDRARAIFEGIENPIGPVWEGNQYGVKSVANSVASLLCCTLRDVCPECHSPGTDYNYKRDEYDREYEEHWCNACGHKWQVRS